MWAALFRFKSENIEGLGGGVEDMNRARSEDIFFVCVVYAVMVDIVLTFEGSVSKEAP